MDYTISIGSNEQRRENMELARRRLTELFGNTFLGRGGDGTFVLSPSESVLNQVACFASDNPVEEVTACLKAIEREAGRKPEEKEQEIVRLDIDLLSCDGLSISQKI